MAIEFGMLQTIKAKSLNATGPKAAQLQQNAAKAEDIFTQAKNTESQIAQANDNGGETGSSTSMAFGQTSMSVEDLQAQLAQYETEFKNLYATINNQPAEQQPQAGENEDDKIKVKPKEFGGLMA